MLTNNRAGQWPSAIVHTRPGRSLVARGRGGGNSPGGQWLGLRILTAEGLRPILVRKLKFHTPHVTAKEKAEGGRGVWRRGGAVLVKKRLLCNLLTVTNNPKVVELGLNPMPELKYFLYLSPLFVSFHNIESYPKQVLSVC